MESAFNGLTFRLQGLVFAVDALEVRGIVGGIEWKADSPSGGPNNGVPIRGEQVPVLDLRERFGFPGMSREGMNSFVAVQPPGSGRRPPVALWVDAVLEIVSVPGPLLKPLPSSFREVPARYLRAMIERPEETVYVLDLGAILAGESAQENDLVLGNKAS